MDTQDIRRRNLQALLDQEFDGNAAELARKIDRSNSQVNDLLAGRKSFGEKFARAIEPMLGKESCWLDTQRDGATAAPDLEFMRSIADASLGREIPEHIKQSIITLISSSPKRGDNQH